MPDHMASNGARNSRTISGESRNRGQLTEPPNHPSSPPDKEQENEPSDILAAINRKRRELRELATSDQPVAPEHRRRLNQQLKDLKEYARHDAELAQLSQGYEIATKPQD